MLCYAMLCYAMLCYAMLCYAMLLSLIQAVLANNALPLATAVPLVNVRSSGMDRSESTLLGMGNVTGGLF